MRKKTPWSPEKGTPPEMQNAKDIENADRRLGGLLTRFEKLPSEHQFTVLKTIKALQNGSGRDPEKAREIAQTQIKILESMVEAGSNNGEESSREGIDTEAAKQALDYWNSEYSDLEEKFDAVDPDDLKKKSWESKKEMRVGKGKRPQKPNPRQFNKKDPEAGDMPNKFREHR